MTVLSSLQALDTRILEIIRSSLTIDTPWFHTFIATFSDSEPILFSAFLIGLWLWGTYKKNDGPKHVALDLFWHVFAAFVIYWIINNILPLRPRPESVIDLPPLIDHLPDNSFPSGHALFFGASWWALHTLLGWRKTTWAFFIVGMITCIVRVIAGIHYPGDILVGFFLGWYIVHTLTKLPHGQKYQYYCHDLPIKLVSYIKL